MMSSEFVWDSARGEGVSVDSGHYDVAKAKRIIDASPREVRTLDLRRLGASIEIWLKSSTFRNNVDWGKVDPGFPVIMAHTRAGDTFPLDGRHRMRKALDDKCEFLRTVELTIEETESIRCQPPPR